MIPFLGLFGSFFSRGFINIIIVTVITVSISGFFLYQRSIIKSKDETISQLNSEINSKNLAIQELQSKVDSLNSLLEIKERQYKQALEEISKFQKLNEESQKRFNELEQKLRDNERNERIKNLLESRKFNLILKFTNDNVKCWMENFYKTNGKCVAGRWIENKE